MPSPVAVVGAISGGLIVGLVPPLVDYLVPVLCKKIAWKAAVSDRLTPLFYFCWLPVMPFAGWLLERESNKDILFFALLVMILGIACLFSARTPRWAVGSILLLGLGYGATTVAVIRFMTVALHWRGTSAASGLNLGFIAVGIGAVLGPWIAARIDRVWGWRNGLVSLGLAMLIPAALVVFSSKDDFPISQHVFDPSQLTTLSTALFVLVILLYFGIENCLDVWPEPYLRELGQSPWGVRFNLSMFWGMFLLSRFAMAWVPWPMYAEPWLLLVLVFISSVALGNIQGMYGSSSGSMGFWLVGAAYGPLLPGFLAMISDRLPASALGIALALSGLDTLLFRPWIIAAAQRQPARSVMRVPTLVAIAMLAPLLVLALMMGR